MEENDDVVDYWDEPIGDLVELPSYEALWPEWKHGTDPEVARETLIKVLEQAEVNADLYDRVKDLDGMQVRLLYRFLALAAEIARPDTIRARFEARRFAAAAPDGIVSVRFMPEGGVRRWWLLVNFA